MHPPWGGPPLFRGNTLGLLSAPLSPPPPPPVYPTPEAAATTCRAGKDLDILGILSSRLPGCPVFGYTLHHRVSKATATARSFELGELVLICIYLNRVAINMSGVKNFPKKCA